MRRTSCAAERRYEEGPYRSASVPVVPLPTAMHAEADVHDTPSRLLFDEPLGFGVGWMAQDLPFQRSASVK
jgi:hypothetical protein